MKKQEKKGRGSPKKGPAKPRPQSANNKSGSEHLKKKGSLQKAIAQPDLVIALSISGYKIIMVNLTKESKLNVAYVKNFEGARSNSVFEECQNEVHADLKEAFAKLKPHYAIINDFKESAPDGIPLDPSEYKAKVLENIKVTGFHLKGEGDKRAIILTGQKKMDNRVGCWNTPNLKFVDAAFPYEHVEALEEVIDEIEKEVILYFGGKFAPPAQQTLELAPGDGEEELEEVEMEEEGEEL